MWWLLSVAFARPDVSLGAETAGAWRGTTRELGAGGRVGVHSRFVSVEAAGSWLHVEETASATGYGYRSRKGELSVLVLTGAEGHLGWQGRRAEVRAGVDVGIGNGVHLGRVCPPLMPGARQLPCSALSYSWRPHALASIGPRLAVGPVWLVARAEPHFSFGNRPSYGLGAVNPRQRLHGWVDLRLGLRVVL